MTWYAPCPPAGLPFVNLSGAPLVLVNALITAPGINTGRIDLPVPVLVGKTYALFYFDTKKTGDVADTGGTSFLIFEDANIFNTPFGFAGFDVMALPTLLGHSFGTVFVDITANPSPLGYQINNSGGATNVTTTISLKGYL